MYMYICMIVLVVMKVWKAVKLDNVSAGVGRDPGFKLTALLVVSTPKAVTGCSLTAGVKALLEYI